MSKSEWKLPDIQTLLNGKIPNAGVLDSLILDLDFKLDENTRQIESSVADLLDIINSIPGVKPVANPKDGLQYIHEQRLLDRSSCYNVHTDHIISFLQNVISILEQHPESSEQVFNQLIAFSEREGVCLAFRSTVSDQVSDSVLSINTVADTSQQQVAQCWEAISRRLQKYFISALAKLDFQAIARSGNDERRSKPSNGTTDFNSPQRNKSDGFEKVDYLQSLKDRKIDIIQNLTRVCSLEETWKQYKKVRHKQLDRHFASLLLNDKDDINITRVSGNCIQLANIIISYINEDFLLLTSDVFSKVMGRLAALTDIYLEKFSDEMCLVVEEIQDELLKQATTKMSQSKSAFGFKSSPIHSLSKMRLHAKSIESELKYVTSDLPAHHSPVPLSYIGIISPIIQAFLLIDQHMENLYNGSVWQVAGASGRRTRSRSNLRSALKASPSPDFKRRTMIMSELGKGDNSDSSDLAATTSSIKSSSDYDESRTPRVERSRTEDRPRWEWRLVFKKIGSDIVTLVDSGIKSGLQTCISDLMTEGSEFQEKELEPGPLLSPEQPSIVFRCVYEFMQVIHKLCPIAEAGISGVFIPARTVFIDTTILSLQKLHTQISKICLGVAHSNPVRHVYISLATSIYIENCLQHYNSALSADKKNVLAVAERLYDDLTRSLSAQCVHVQTQLINDHILFAASSNDWTSNKEFYENERCSMNVQMWSYQLQCFQNDLWSVCPGRVSQHILLSVLDATLDTLTRRYCKLTPSHRRLIQFRGDLVSILLIGCEMLHYVSRSVSQLLDSGQHQPTHLNIHNNCSLLLATLSVITSPLHIVYKVFKKGFASSRLLNDTDSHSDDTSGGYPSQWLSWLHPEIYLHTQNSVADMQTTNALYILVKLISHQPTPSYNLILQALTAKEYTLPILLLTSAVVPQAESNESIHKSNVYALFTALFTVLSLEDHFHDALAKLCLPVIDRLDMWQQLSVENFASTLDDPPVLLTVILDVMKPFSSRVVENVIREVIHTQGMPPPVDAVGLWGHTLPCGCPCQSPERSQRFADGKDITDWCIREVVQTFSDDIGLLPTPLCVLFKNLQETVASQNIKVARGCIGLQFIAGGMRNALLDFAHIERVACCELTAGTKDKLTNIAEAIYVTVNAIVKTPGLTRTASHFRKRNKEWLALKLEAIISYLHSPLFETPDSTAFSDETTEFSDDLMTAVIERVLAKQAGEFSIQLLYNIIVNNKQWLATHLDIRPALPWLHPLTHKQLRLTADLIPRSFSHLVMYRAVGDFHFSQSTVMEFSLDWLALLQSDLGLTEHSFRSLLLRREDMHDSSQLTEADAKYAQVLRSRFTDSDSL